MNHGSNWRSSRIKEVPIAAIDVLNPRARDPRVFKEIVTSIDHVGLKKPIAVSIRKQPNRYELVCGQGRIEAFAAMGQKTIPAILLDVSTEDCLLMSLVENLARCRPTSVELLHEVGRLAKTYSVKEIAAKLDFSPEYIASICYLLKHGEERLLNAVEKGKIPHSIAIEIARAKSGATQDVILQACKQTSLSGKQISKIRKLADERDHKGREIYVEGRRKKENPGIVAAALVKTYREETDRRRMAIKKAELAQTRLLFIVNALRTLLNERMFVTLLREESMQKLPLLLLRRITQKES